MTQRPLRATRVSPRGSQPTLGFCFAATAKQVLLGYKKALEAGQAGSRAAGIHARALAGCHRLTCQGKQCYLPRDHGTKNTTTAAQTPNTGSRGRACQPAAPREEPGCPAHTGSIPRLAVPNGERGTGTASPSAPGSRAPSPERCRAGRQGQPRQPRAPGAGQTFRRCHSALPSSRASSDFLLI